MRTPLCVVAALCFIGVDVAVVQTVQAAETAGEFSQDDGSSETPGPASAESPEAAPSPAPASFLKPAESDHQYQTGLHIMPGTGYRVIVPYAENKTCGDSSENASKRVCTHLVPFFIDLQLSFGSSKRLDLLLDVRFGVGADPATGGSKSRQFALSPGVRFWLDQDVNLKFYSTVQAVYDQTAFAHVRSSDFGLRNANGLMYDTSRNLGVFFQVGETIGFLRWFRMELDVGLGVQLRLP